MVDLSINYSYLNRHIKYLGSYLKVGICVVSIFLYKMGVFRNFGGGMMVMSQTPDNFPELFHTNVATKIILHTAASDIPKVRAVTGIKDVSLFKHLEHTNKSGHFDVALMKDRVGEWVAVRLPWYEK